MSRNGHYQSCMQTREIIWTDRKLERRGNGKRDEGERDGARDSEIAKQYWHFFQENHTLHNQNEVWFKTIKFYLVTFS